jgi:hypothetical protein
MILHTLSSDRAPAAPRPMPGTGTRLTLRADAFAISTPRAPSGTRGKLRFVPLRVNDAAILLTRGLVNGSEPTVAGERMSQMAIRIDSSKATEAGESWLAVEVETQEDGILRKGSRVEVIHTDDPMYFTPTIARYPLTLIVWKGKLAVLIDQVVHWNLQYHRVPESRGSGLRPVFL